MKNLVMIIVFNCFLDCCLVKTGLGWRKGRGEVIFLVNSLRGGSLSVENRLTATKRNIIKLQ